MGVIISIIFSLFIGLIVLGFFVNLFKAAYNGIRNNSAIWIASLIYIWLLISYTKATLWISGISIILLISVAYISTKRDAEKIRNLISPLLQSKDISKIKNFYQESSDSDKKNILDTIIKSNSTEKFGIINSLFLMDFLKIINHNRNKKTEEFLMERADLETELKKVWDGKIDDSYFLFKESPFDDLETEILEVMYNGNDKNNKGKIIQLIKIRKRQQRDPFENAIEL